MSDKSHAQRLWKVKRRGKTHGPFTQNQLLSMSDKQFITSVDLVTEDRVDADARQHWRSLEQLLVELQPARASAEQPAIQITPGVQTTLPDYRPLNFCLSLLTIAQLAEILAGVLFILRLIVHGLTSDRYIPAVDIVLLCAYGVLAVMYHVLNCVGYSQACRVSDQLKPRGITIALLILYVFDFLLDLVLLVLLIVTFVNDLTFSIGRITYESWALTICFAFGARLLLWFPVSSLNQHWLLTIVKHASQHDEKQRYTAQSLNIQSFYFSILYAVRYLLLAIIILIAVLIDVPSQRIYVMLGIFVIVYGMFVAVTGCWRGVMHLIAWRMASHLSRKNPMS